MLNTVADSVRLNMPYPDRLSRSEILLKWGFASMIYITLWAWYRRWADLYTFIAFWAILFTGRYPRRLFDFISRTMAAEFKEYCYFPLLLTDHEEPDYSHPLNIEFDYPEHCSPGKASVQFITWPLVAVGIWVATILLFLTAIPAWWIILFTGKYPKFMYGFNIRSLHRLAQFTAWKNHMR